MTICLPLPCHSRHPSGSIGPREPQSYPGPAVLAFFLDSDHERRSRSKMHQHHFGVTVPAPRVLNFVLPTSGFFWPTWRKSLGMLSLMDDSMAIQQTGSRFST
jgi:hypothetical protein